MAIAGIRIRQNLVVHEPYEHEPYEHEPHEHEPHEHEPGAASERGSALPLLTGIFLIALATYMMAVNIYFLQAEKLKLERWGEDVIANLYQEVAHENYYFGNSEIYTEGIRSFVEVDCSSLISNLKEKIKKFPNTKNLVSSSCSSGRLKISLSEAIRLPFLPQGLSNFQPTIVIHVEAGLQRVRSKG